MLKEDQAVISTDKRIAGVADGIRGGSTIAPTT